jgi:hypothetical protein
MNLVKVIQESKTEASGLVPFGAPLARHAEPGEWGKRKAITLWLHSQLP